MTIDTEYDFRLDSGGRDSDYASQTLRNYHQRLWSKPLPDGKVFEIVHDPSRYSYLIGETRFGTMFLSSDSITTSMSVHKKLQPVLSQIPESDLERFKSAGSTIGARIVFSGKKVNGLQTINQARGFSSQVRDRFDLTLECIRLFYIEEPSPLSDVPSR